MPRFKLLLLPWSELPTRCALAPVATYLAPRRRLGEVIGQLVAELVGQIASDLVTKLGATVALPPAPEQLHRVRRSQHAIDELLVVWVAVVALESRVGLMEFIAARAIGRLSHVIIETLERPLDVPALELGHGPLDLVARDLLRVPSVPLFPLIRVRQEVGLGVRLLLLLLRLLLRATRGDLRQSVDAATHFGHLALLRIITILQIVTGRNSFAPARTLLTERTTLITTRLQFLLLAAIVDLISEVFVVALVLAAGIAWPGRMTRWHARPLVVLISALVGFALLVVGEVVAFKAFAHLFERNVAVEIERLGTKRLVEDLLLRCSYGIIDVGVEIAFGAIGGTFGGQRGIDARIADLRRGLRSSSLSRHGNTLSFFFRIVEDDEDAQ